MTGGEVSRRWNYVSQVSTIAFLSELQTVIDGVDAIEFPWRFASTKISLGHSVETRVRITNQSNRSRLTSSTVRAELPLNIDVTRAKIAVRVRIIAVTLYFEICLNPCAPVGRFQPIWFTAGHENLHVRIELCVFWQKRIMRNYQRSYIRALSRYYAHLQTDRTIIDRF